MTDFSVLEPYAQIAPVIFVLVLWLLACRQRVKDLEEMIDEDYKELRNDRIRRMNGVNLTKPKE